MDFRINPATGKSCVRVEYITLSLEVPLLRVDRGNTNRVVSIACMPVCMSCMYVGVWECLCVCVCVCTCVWRVCACVCVCVCVLGMCVLGVGFNETFVVSEVSSWISY